MRPQPLAQQLARGGGEAAGRAVAAAGAPADLVEVGLQMGVRRGARALDALPRAGVGQRVAAVERRVERRPEPRDEAARENCGHNDRGDGEAELDLVEREHCGRGK